LPNPAQEKTSTDCKRIVIDVDGTLCEEKTSEMAYCDVKPSVEIINQLKEYKKAGFYIIIYSSRQMRTYSGNIGRINAQTLPVLVEWLKKHDVPYDELIVGKPWCGFEGFYVDDKTVRPDEFLKLSYEQIQKLLKTKRKDAP
jgi:capsule biosynthesis phosphatase